MAQPAQERRPLEKPDLYVVARFLDRLCRPDKTYSKAKLQVAVRINYDLFRRYLSFLEDKGWVRVVQEQGHSEVVRVTPLGLHTYHHLVDWIRQFIGGGVL